MSQYFNKNNQIYNPINHSETKFHFEQFLKNSKNITQNESQLLKHLIRFPFFKKELKEINNSSQIYKGYLIKSDIIKIFKEKYDLKNLFDILEKNKLFDGINYSKCDSNYQNILKFLDENNNVYLNGIKKIENSEIPYNFKPNEGLFLAKFINNNQIYLDEFEIIDESFCLYLQGLYKNNIQIIPVNYILIEGKIVLSIIYGQKYIYEIVYINPEGGNIIVEYLIEPIINNNNISTDINSIIFQPFQKNGLKNLISLGQSLKINDSISIYIHKIINKALNHSKTLKYFNVPNDIRNLLPFSSNKNKSISNKEISKNQILDYNIRKGYLIDQKFFKSMSPILNLDNNNAYYTKFFEAKIDFKSNKIQNASLTKNNIVLYYPINFYIINNETFDKINKTANNTLKINLFEEINFIKVNGGIIFAPKNNNFLFNNNNLIYIYSSKKIEQAQLNEPIAIIECNNIVDRNNKFILINKELGNKNIIKNPVGYFSKVKLSCHLININNTIGNNINEDTPNINIRNLNITSNNILENQKLINELNIYKRENEKLKNEINELRIANNKLNTELINIKNNLSSYQKKIQENNNEIYNLKNIIKEKENELNNLKIKSGIFVDFNKIMVINFISLDYNIDCGIKCLPTDTFAEVEEKLYQEYENCRETNNNFICGGKMILRFKKISENKIKNGDKIQLIKPE